MNRKTTIDRLHEKCYYLMFLPARHIPVLYDYFTLENENEEEFKSLIRFINRKAQLPSRKGFQKTPHESEDYHQMSLFF